jgi:hypothetical protein
MDNEDVDKVACFERPPRKYTPMDLPWVSVLWMWWSSLPLIFGADARRVSFTSSIRRRQHLEPTSYPPDICSFVDLAPFLVSEFETQRIEFISGLIAGCPIRSGRLYLYPPQPNSI